MVRSKAAAGTGRAGALFAALCGVLSLAGCMTATTPLPPAPPPAPAPAEVTPPPAPEASFPPHPARKPTQRALASLSVPGAVPPTGEAEPDFSRLTGLDQDETVAMLGQPQQRADSPPAVLWRYTSSACELDVYFYLDLQSREMRVLHYELRDNDGSDRTGQKCYSELLSARRAD